MSRVFVEFFCQVCVSHHGFLENFQIYAVQITGKCICQSNNCYALFHWAKLPQVLSVTLILSQALFF